MCNTPEEIRHTTSGSFTKRRDKIKSSSFEILSQKLVSEFYDKYDYKKYNGYRLIAIDGSVYTLPRTKETIKEFGDNVLSDSKKWIKAQVSHAADVLNNICVDQKIASYKTSEKTLLLEHLSNLCSDDLLLFDRGYYSFEVLKKLSDRNNKFCFRVKRKACKIITCFADSDDIDIETTINHEGECCHVRLTKVKLKGGEIEYLLTNLFDQKVFTTSELKILYHLRWGVEEQFKDFKHAIAIENFTGKKVNSVYQEFYGNSIYYNICMMTCTASVNKKLKRIKRKHKYKANKRSILAQMKLCVVRIFKNVSNLHEIALSIINNLVSEAVPIRNNRSYKREVTYKAKKKWSRNTNPIS